MAYKFLILTFLIACFSKTAYANEKDVTPRNCPQSNGVSTKDEIKTFYKIQTSSVNAMTNVKRIYYGPSLDQFGDLRLPPGKGPFPVVVVVHGGAWKSIVSLDYTAPIAELLTKSGFATWNVEYSRLGSGGEWPGIFKSVAAAADYVHTLASTYPLNTGKIATIGHSSGGHLALWLAARHNIKEGEDLFSPQPIRVNGVVSLDGTPDLEAFAALDRGKAVIPQVVGVGSGGDTQKRYKVTSPVEMLPLGVPQFFLTQDSDRLPSILNYISKANTNGDKVKYELICPGNHFTTADITEPKVRDEIVKAIREILN